MAQPSVSRLCGWRLAGAIVLLGIAGLAQAQSAGTETDPPDRVARLAYLAGDVGLLPAGSQDWIDADINRPLTRGDRLATDDGARAELELDGATLRIDGHSDFGFLELDDPLAQVELTQGTLGVTVRRLEPGQSYEIDTPTVALVIEQPGTFRVDIDADSGAAQVTVRDGSATVYGENDAQRRVVAGRSYRFDDSSLNAVVLTEAGSGDAFDAWSADRDQRYQASESSRYVSADVVGYQDLDRYGDWRDDPDYGRVWYPRQVGSDWAPYREGHWTYIAPWGWTWVDDSPWGFAPYHYGRWAFVRSRWCWVPGPVAIRPVYAPALVAFVGGTGWNLSLGVAPIGWFPLGPGEIYDPWYHGSRRYFTRINLSNLRRSRHHRHDRIEDRIDRHYDRYRHGLPPVRAEHYAHRDARGLTAVPAQRFAEARPVAHHRLYLDARELDRAPLLAAGATPRPDRHSPSTHRVGRALPGRGFQRAVVSRHAPPTLAGVERVARGTSRPNGGARADAAVPAARRFEHATRAPVRRETVAVSTMDPAAHGRTPRSIGELRSARFVHRPVEPAVRTAGTRPRARSLDSADAAHAARPGVSYIAHPDRERRARERPTREARLPSVPRIERAPAGFAAHPTRSTVSAPRPARPPAQPQPRFERRLPRGAPAPLRRVDPRRQSMPAARVEPARHDASRMRTRTSSEARRPAASAPAPAPARAAAKAPRHHRPPARLEPEHGNRPRR